jgi:hypothetical protein
MASRSPIERMVDEATGYTGPADLPGPGKQPHELLIAVADAAKSWWESQRPVSMDQRQHFSNPGINCRTSFEYELAKAVAKLVKTGW